MNKQDIVQRLKDCGFINDSAATQIHQFTTIGRSSLTTLQVDNRNSKGWVRGEYIIANYENDSLTLDKLLDGWQRIAERYKNQYLIIEVTRGEWKLFNSNCQEMGGNEFIMQLFSKRQQVNEYMQKIYYGCPGSGKSHKVNKFLEERGVAEKFQIRTTFHPDTDYASFVGCYKPSMKDGNIEYNYSAQVFTEAYVKAWKNPEESVYLIIEEINRGNCAQIFGDLFQLLDRDKNTGVSEYPIKADKDLADYLRREDVLGAEHEGIKDGKLRLPSNLIIYATMNTSDQSLFPMDSAFKRRWDWEYVPIDYSANKDSFHFTIKIGDAEYSWIKFLENVNDKITKVTHSEDKQMGNYFIKKSISQEEFVNKVMFYIWNEVCKEEWNTDGNFFRRKDNKEFKFTDLFTTEAEAILNEFMIETIGIQPIGKEDK